MRSHLQLSEEDRTHASQRQAWLILPGSLGDRSQRRIRNPLCGKGNPPTLLVGMYIGAATMENSMEVPQKTKNTELSYDPAIPLLGIYPENIFKKV